jgi:hypothetical protein
LRFAFEVEATYYHAIADRGKAAEIYKVLFNLFPDSLDYGMQLAKLPPCLLGGCHPSPCRSKTEFLMLDSYAVQRQYYIGIKSI